MLLILSHLQNRFCPFSMFFLDDQCWIWHQNENVLSEYDYATNKKITDLDCSLSLAKRLEQELDGEDFRLVKTFFDLFMTGRNYTGKTTISWKNNEIIFK